MITRRQYKKLKSIYRADGTTAKDINQNRELYRFLSSKGYIKRQEVRGYNGYVVTQEGEIEMKLYREDIFRFWITTIISFVALIASIISIAMQTTPVQQLLIQLSKQLSQLP